MRSEVTLARRASEGVLHSSLARRANKSGAPSGDPNSSEFLRALFFGPRSPTIFLPFCLTPPRTLHMLRFATSFLLLIGIAHLLSAQPAPGETKGHSDLIHSVAFSPDGKTVAT